VRAIDRHRDAVSEACLERCASLWSEALHFQKQARFAHDRGDQVMAAWRYQMARRAMFDWQGLCEVIAELESHD
jgi:hypothetical protein